MQRNCGDCEQPISPIRLRALPDVTRCFKCQENLESAEDTRVKTHDRVVSKALATGSSVDPEWAREMANAVTGNGTEI